MPYLLGMQSKVYPVLPSITDLSRAGERCYCAQSRLMASLRTSSGWTTLCLLDITHAGESGKDCPRLTITVEESSCGAMDDLDHLIAVVKHLGDDLRVVFDTVLAKPFPSEAHNSEIRQGPIIFRRDANKSIRTYSPFARYKPLSAEPSKWNMAHVIRALWCSQFEDLRCNGRYSDDYAYDAASNFGEGAITDGRLFAARIIESPSGWWVSRSGDLVTVSCHQFDHNSFKFKL